MWPGFFNLKREVAMSKHNGRTCSNCAFGKKEVCISKSPDNRACDKWLNEKANCLYCSFYEDCRALGKEVGGSIICVNFEKRPRKISTGSKTDSHRPDKPSIEIPKPIDSDTTFSPVSLIEQVIKSGYNQTAFASIDDSDIPVADNPVRFITGKNFLNIKPFARQLQIYLDFFAAYCPYCSDTDWIRTRIEVNTPLGEIRDRTILYSHGVCPKCRRNRYEAICDNMHRQYTQLVGIAGQRSGKSTSVAALGATITHMYLSLPNAVETYNLLPNSMIHGTFVGLRYNDAYDNLWMPYYNLLSSSPWFKQYHDFLDAEGERLGIELYKLRDTFVAYGMKNIGVYPSGPDKRKLRGRTRMFACLSGDSIINTPKGMVNIASLEKGDSVLIGGKEFKIRERFHYDKAYLYSVVLKYGFKIKGTKSHKVKVLLKNLDFKWVKVEDLSRSMHVAVNIGSHFPEELFIPCSDYSGCFKTLLKKMQELNQFTLLEIADQLSSFKSAHSVLQSLITHGIVYRHSYSRETGTVYRTSGELNFLLTSISQIPDRMDSDLAYILGYLILGGHYDNQSIVVSFSSKDESIVSDFIDKIEKLFFVPCKVSRFSSPTGGEVYQASFSNLHVRLFLDSVGLKNDFSKDIPWVILQSPKNCVIDFIKAFMSGCDVSNFGSILIKDFVYDSDIILRLQVLFLNLGVLTERKEHALYTASEYDTYKLLNLIGGKPAKKKFLFADPYRIPYLTETVYNTSDITCLADTVSRKARELIDSGMVFIPVEKVEDLQMVTPVFDLEIDSEDHAYVANGMIVHNSIDELGWFLGREGNIQQDPDEVYTALDNSLTTIVAAANNIIRDNPAIPTAYGLYVTSPSSKVDKGMRLYKYSIGSDRIYGFKYRTEELNPNVTAEDLSHKFKEDPLSAERDFGANPPFAVDPYIKTPALLLNTFTTKRNLFHLRGYKTVKDSLSQTLVYPSVRWIKTHTWPAVLAIDCGYNKNSFSCTLCHWFRHNGEKVLAVSGIVEIQPIIGPISFVDVYSSVIKPIISQFNVKMVGSDRWQSINLTQQVYKDFGIDAVIYSVKYPDFDTLRNKIHAEEIIFPRIEVDISKLIILDQPIENIIDGNPVSHLFLQMLMCKDNGKSVSKGIEVSDDVLRSVALGVSIILNDDYKHKFSGEGEETSKFVDIRSMISVALKSSSRDMGRLSSHGGYKIARGVGVSSSRVIPK
jgi:intein/homing endonuclease